MSGIFVSYFYIGASVVLLTTLSPGPRLSPQVWSRAQPPLFCSLALCGPSKPHWVPCGQHFIDFSASDQSFYGAFGSLSIHTHTLTHALTHTHTRPTLQSSWRGRGLEAAVATCPSHHPRASLGFSLLGEFTGLPVLFIWSLGGVFLAACGLQFPEQGLNRGPLHWERGVLAVDPRGSPRLHCSLKT